METGLFAEITGLSPLHDRFVTATPDQLKRTEEELHINLPDDYKNFISLYGASTFSNEVGVLCENKTGWEDKNALLHVNFFYSAAEDDFGIKKYYHMYETQIPNGLIPIADAEGGNQLCIGVSGQYAPAVFFWDHENDVEKSLFKIADNFSDFLKLFRLVPTEQHNSSEQPALVSFWFSDDF